MAGSNAGDENPDQRESKWKEAAPTRLVQMARLATTTTTPFYYVGGRQRSCSMGVYVGLGRRDFRRVQMVYMVVRETARTTWMVAFCRLSSDVARHGCRVIPNK